MKPEPTQLQPVICEVRRVSTEDGCIEGLPEGKCPYCGDRLRTGYINGFDGYREHLENCVAYRHRVRKSIIHEPVLQRSLYSRELPESRSTKRKDLHLLKPEIRKLTNTEEKIKCPICEVSVDRKEYPRHIANTHHPLPKDIRCPYCRLPVAFGKYVAHFGKSHSVKTKTAVNQGLATGEGEHLFEQFIQDSYEPRDGSKGFHRWGENGKYGSHAIMDDYGDESNPN